MKQLKEFKLLKAIAWHIGVLALAVAPQISSAQATADGFLGKGEVEGIAAGKIWLLVSASTKDDIRWDIRKNGTLYGNNRTRNSSDTASWTIKDNGTICTVWKGNSTNRCLFVKKDNEKYQVFDEKAPAVLIATVIAE